MHFSSSLFLQASAVAAVKLYIAETNGNVTTLALTQTSDIYNLDVAYKTLACAPNPAALIHDAENKLLYCYDRGSSSSTNGSMNSFSVSADGNLSQIARVNAPLSGVSATIFGDGSARGIATAA